MSVRILNGDCRGVLASLPAESVHCVVTSPPYWGLRDYGTAKWEGGDPACAHVVGEIRTGLGMAALGEKWAGGGHKVSEPKPMTAKHECPHCGARRIDFQIGLESTYQEYVEQMVAVFREVKRVLRKDGTLWLNLGDTYHGGGGGNYGDSKSTRTHHEHLTNVRNRIALPALKPKDICGIPWRVAFALQADG
jgi:site-specific DNA-methyltransferase (cytosine-N4-specific)